MVVGRVCMSLGIAAILVSLAMPYTSDGHGIFRVRQRRWTVTMSFANFDVTHCFLSLPREQMVL